MPGGVVQNPPPNVQAAVQRSVPAFPIERFNMIASIYAIEYEHEAEPPAQVRKRMDRIGKNAADLWIELGTLSGEAQDALFAGSAKIGIATPDLFSSALRSLMMAARHAEREVTGDGVGRGRGALAAAVSRLAGAMEHAGLTLDAKPNGDLVTLTRHLLEAYGHNRGPALKAVQRHLDKIPPGSV